MGRRHKCHGLAACQLHRERARGVQVLQVVEAALALLPVEEAPIPETCLEEARARQPEPERRRPGEGLDATAVGQRFDREAPVGAAVGLGVVVPVRGERLQAKPYRRWRREERVAEQGRVVAVRHPERLLDLAVTAAVAPDGEGAVEVEPREIAMACRMDRPVVVLGRVERVALVSDRELLVHPGEQERARHRRAQRRHQQPVVAARVDARHRSRRVAAKPVGDQPLEGQRRRQNVRSRQRQGGKVGRHGRVGCHGDAPSG